VWARAGALVWLKRVRGLRHTRLELRPCSTWRNSHAIRKGETTRDPKRTLPSSSYKDERCRLAGPGFEPGRAGPPLSLTKLSGVFPGHTFFLACFKTTSQATLSDTWIKFKPGRAVQRNNSLAIYSIHSYSCGTCTVVLLLVKNDSLGTLSRIIPILAPTCFIWGP
jgi:hypothetical protein